MESEDQEGAISTLQVISHSQRNIQQVAGKTGLGNGRVRTEEHILESLREMRIDEIQQWKQCLKE
jgi:UDP-3-O-acyl-N-acetylglucosamine deacetylase